MADETRSAELESRTAAEGGREAEAPGMQSAAAPAPARKSRRIRRKAGWTEFIVDVWITNFHWVKFGLYKHSRNQAKSRQFTSDMDIFAEVIEHGERTRLLGYREDLWHKHAGMDRRLVLKLFNETLNWRASMDLMIGRSLQLTLGARGLPVTAFSINVGEHDDVVYLERSANNADLEQLMDAVRALPDPFQRASLIVARWSGARRNEIRRLTTDCLDEYPDGTARLRVPVGKTARERLVPLHDEAAEALRTVLAIRAKSSDRRLPDERTGELVRFVFVWRGKLMSDRHLFGTPLKRVCDAAGLVDFTGRPMITMHRFRHTLGTELAERGAKLHTHEHPRPRESPDDDGLRAHQRCRGAP